MPQVGEMMEGHYREIGELKRLRRIKGISRAGEGEAKLYQRGYQLVVEKRVVQLVSREAVEEEGGMTCPLVQAGKFTSTSCPIHF